jgi:nucleoside-diphosphate-sugar epimerase
MKILVTGGLGFIGHNVVAHLESQGHACIITDTRTTYGIVPQAELDYLIAERQTKIKTDRIYSIDIADRDGIAWLIREHRPDTVIHLASFPRQKVVNANPQVGSQTMSEGLLNLLEASSQGQVQKFVYVSSSMVYGDFVESSIDGIHESHPTSPIGQYGIMKLAGEWLTRDYTRRTGMAHTIIRPSAVYGPLDVEDRVVSKFLLAAMRNGILNVNGGEECLDFTYVDDAAQGIANAAVSDNTGNTTYNITRGHAQSLLQAAKLCVDIVGRGHVQIKLPDANFPKRGQLNIQRARLDFEYRPQVNIEQGFRLYYDWLNSSEYWNTNSHDIL